MNARPAAYRLRQVALVAADLAAAEQALCRAFGLAVCYRDPVVAQWGLVNAVMPAGGDFLEVVSPAAAGTAAGRYLARRGGDGGYMVILHTADALAERGRIAGLGVRTAHRTDQPAYRATHFHPADTGHVLLSVDDADAGAAYGEALSDWPPGGPDWRRHVRTERVSGLAAVALQSADPERQAETWARVLALPLERRHGVPTLALGQGELRFVPERDGRGAGVESVDLAAADRAAVLAEAAAMGLPCDGNRVAIAGLAFNLV